MVSLLRRIRYIAHRPDDESWLSGSRFLFVLSGFVIGYAYDGRWSRGAPLRCCMACMRGLVRGYNPYGVAGYEILRYACAPALVEAGQAVE